MDAITSVLPLVALTLWSVPVVKGMATITGCTDAFIRLQCPPGHTLSVHRLQLAAGDGGVCSGGVSNGRSPPQVPPNLAKLCTAASECPYRDNVCQGKTDCVFYIGPQFLKGIGQVRDNSPVSVTYSCEAGTVIFGSTLGITIVTLALVLALIVAIFIICRRAKAQEEDAMSKYVQFDKGLSRSPSMASELQPPGASSSNLHPTMTDNATPDTTIRYSNTDQDAIGGFVSRGPDIETIDTTQATVTPSASTV